MLNRESELRRKLTKLAASQDTAGKQTAEEAAKIGKDMVLLTAELELVEAQIRAASPRYAALTQPQPLSVHSLPSAPL